MLMGDGGQKQEKIMLSVSLPGNLCCTESFPAPVLLHGLLFVKKGNWECVDVGCFTAYCCGWWKGR